MGMHTFSLVRRQPARVFERLESRTLLYGGPTGPQFLVNTYTTARQQSAEVAMDADGDFVAVWASLNQDGSGYGIYGQRYNSAGIAQGSEFRISSYTTDYQWYPTVAMDPDGDFAVVWQSRFQDGGIDSGIFGQRFNAAGVAQGAEFHINTYTTGHQGDAVVAMDALGNFVVAWYSTGQDGSGNGVYAQRYNSAGVAQGAEFRVNTYTTSSQWLPDVAMDDAGNFVVVWASVAQDGDSYGIYAQRYNAAGVAQGAEFRVNTTTTGIQVLPEVAMDADGDFVVVWQGAGVGTYDIFAQRYDAAGVAQGAEFRANAIPTGLQMEPEVAMDAGGQFVVVWSGFATSVVQGQFFSATGVAQGAQFQANTSPAVATAEPAVAMDADGDAVVLWNYPDASDIGIAARRYGGDFDDDGDVDADDVELVCDFIYAAGADPNNNDSPDLNSDGVVNQDDMDAMIGSVLQTMFGDADLDRDVDGADFDRWRLRAGYTGPGTGTWAHGDFDCDGDVDGADFELWRTRPTAIPGTGFAPTATAAMAATPTSSVGSIIVNSSQQSVSTEGPMDPQVLAPGAQPKRKLAAVDETFCATAMYRSRHLARRAGIGVGDPDLLLTF